MMGGGGEPKHLELGAIQSISPHLILTLAQEFLLTKRIQSQNFANPNQQTATERNHCLRNVLHSSLQEQKKTAHQGAALTEHDTAHIK